MGKIKIKLVKSLISCTKVQRQTVQALGLGKVSSEVEVEATPQILGMVQKVNHLVSIVEQ
jgi:large subunit ribosomal protein L30